MPYFLSTRTTRHESRPLPKTCRSRNSWGHSRRAISISRVNAPITPLVLHGHVLPKTTLCEVRSVVFRTEESGWIRGYESQGSI